MSKLAARFLADQDGATSIEYAAIASGISIAIFMFVNGIGIALRGSFIVLNTSLQ